MWIVTIMFSSRTFRLYFFNSRLPLFEFPPVFSYYGHHYGHMCLINNLVCVISCTFTVTLCLVNVMFKVFATACLPASLELFLLNLELFGTLFICLCFLQTPVTVISCLTVVTHLHWVKCWFNGLITCSNHLTFSKTVTFLSIINIISTWPIYCVLIIVLFVFA